MRREIAIDTSGRLVIPEDVRARHRLNPGTRLWLEEEGDRLVLDLLVDGMRAINGNLNQIARAINTGRVVTEGDVVGSIKDAHSVATAVAAELAEMARRSAAARRREGI